MTEGNEYVQKNSVKKSKVGKAEIAESPLKIEK